MTDPLIAPGRLEELATEIEHEVARAKSRHGSVPRAADYAPLVGKYVRMWREATPEEHTMTGSPEVGMEDLIVCVADQGTGTVEVYGECHMVFPITEADADQWRFMIWPSEAARQATPGVEPRAL